MNIVFYLIIAITITILWFAMSFIFKPLGRFFYRLWKDAIDEMTNEDK